MSAEDLELEELRSRLAEAESNLQAIYSGEIDALLLADEQGERRVFTLRSADAPYRALVEQMHEGAVTLTLEGAVIYANRGFARLVDVPLEQVIGSSINRFVASEDHAVLDPLIRSGAGTLRTCLLVAGQGLLDVHISVSHVTVDDEEHRTLIVTDMSTLTKVQRESQSKDEFLAMLAHELRNPLAPIRTGLQVLRLQPGEEAAERTREMMERQVGHMVRIIDDLLDVSRVSRGKIELKKELIDLKAVVGLAVETSLPLIEAGRHELAVRIAPEPLPVMADATRLAQVFSNLLNNASRRSPEGGDIWLTTASVGGEAHIAVTDEGPPLSPEAQQTVFDMFALDAQASADEAGLGIGLAVVKELVKAHGGSVTASSPDAARGAKFLVKLPLLSAQR